MKRNKLHIIDGNSLLFRAYYATAAMGAGRIMRTKDGVATNALVAFANMIAKILNELEQGDSIFVPFDTGEKTFRHEAFPDYKGTRREVPEDLISQFPLARDFLDALSIKHFEVVGYEADDIAGTVARLAEQTNLDVVIHTSDQDYFQLISEHITVRVPKPKGAVLNLTPTVLMEQYNLKPEQVTSFKGLVGDASDNLPGVPGVGKKTAEKLLNEYGDLETILDNAHLIPGKLGFSLKDNAQKAAHSKYLATLVTDVPLNFALSALEYTGYDFNTVHNFATRYELRTFLRNLKQIDTPSAHAEEEITIKAIENTSALTFSDTLDVGVVLSEENYFNAKIVAFYLSVNNVVYKLDYDDFITDTKLHKALSNKTIKIRTFDYKKLAVSLRNINISINNLAFDFMLASYLVDSNIDSLETTFLRNFGYNAGEESEAALALLLKNASNLEKAVIAKLKEHELLDVYYNVEQPLVDVLIEMESAGFPLDAKMLNAIGNDYKVVLEELRTKISAYSTEEINVNSPQQIAKLLYDDLALPGPKNRSTSVDVLQKLASKHPVVNDILEYRKYAKIISTYIDGLIPHILSDGKVHTSFRQALTTTGRLSSINPNLQNISVRDELGREIRKAFYYEDALLLSLDYSQIELRLLASFSKEQKLIEVFNSNRDIHSETAAALFPLEELEDARRKAKAVNFGIVYGISDWGLAEQLQIAPGAAKALIDAFYLTYPGLLAYRNDVIRDVSANGYVLTFSGRRRYIPEINDANYQRREFAKRAAMNAPLQGSAADIIKLAMIAVHNFLTTNNYKTKLVLQIHDELLFKLDPSEEHLVKELQAIMENVVDFAVKLRVNNNIGASWYLAS